MKNFTEQPNKQSNLQTLEADFSLTKKELEDFKKLPKAEQEKQKKEELSKLRELNDKLDHAIQEAVQTGQLEEAKKLKEQLEKKMQNLEQQIEQQRKEKELRERKPFISTEDKNEERSLKGLFLAAGINRLSCVVLHGDAGQLNLMQVRAAEELIKNDVSGEPIFLISIPSEKEIAERYVKFKELLEKHPNVRLFTVPFDIKDIKKAYNEILKEL